MSCWLTKTRAIRTTSKQASNEAAETRRRTFDWGPSIPLGIIQMFHAKTIDTLPTHHPPHPLNGSRSVFPIYISDLPNAEAAVLIKRLRNTCITYSSLGDTNSRERERGIEELKLKFQNGKFRGKFFDCCFPPDGPNKREMREIWESSIDLIDRMHLPHE